MSQQESQFSDKKTLKNLYLFPLVFFMTLSPVASSMAGGGSGSRCKRIDAVRQPAPARPGTPQ